MLFAFILATSLTAISEKRKSMSGIPEPEATSRASLLEVIEALRQKTKAFFIVFSSGFKSCEVAVCYAIHPYSKTGLTRPIHS